MVVHVVKDVADGRLASPEFKNVDELKIIPILRLSGNEKERVVRRSNGNFIQLKLLHLVDGLERRFPEAIGNSRFRLHGFFLSIEI